MTTFASGVDPVLVDHLPEGDYRVSVSDLGGQRIADQVVSVTAGAVTDIAFAITSVPVAVELRTWSVPCRKMSLDGIAAQCLGRTARFGAVLPGTYQVCVTYSAGEPVCSTVTVRHNVGPLQRFEVD